MKHEEIYNDHQFLWRISPADDMSGGYVDQDDLDDLLKNPTKATAKRCLLRQIQHWIEDGIEDNEGKYQSTGSFTTFAEIVKDYPEVQEIADKYNLESNW